ncbi:hypothetical protein BN12_2420004 [Nostocoides japonicum T1-X7]|uniref:ANTAR domain-containing protein n=1 Tax=Nostocoides japonicum T1-X7 TaxID=1194083 RepID=A0A077LWB0_9MICO|nr:hypothetical protein [Tetrasphaera japonica]CCH78021.1 hypothetical protein BN12_2420004 [Tetrasphaera japonica T1-X7]
MALGILMGTRRTGLDDARLMLSKASQDSDVKLSLLLDHVLHTGTLDTPPGGWGVLRGCPGAAPDGSVARRPPATPWAKTDGRPGARRGRMTAS